MAPSPEPRTLLAVSLIRAERLKEDVEEAFTAGADLVELRVDLIDELSAVTAVLSGPRASRVVVTVRRGDEGGAWRGDEPTRLGLLRRLAQFRPGYIDIELRALQESPDIAGFVKNELVTPQSATRPMISLHEFGAPPSPEGLGREFRAMASRPVVVKAVFSPRDGLDALDWPRRLIESIGRGPENVVVLGVGDAGLLTRVLAPKFGRFLAYSALRDDAEAAPGQPTIATLRELYGWRSIDAHTKLYGVIGWPLGHSRSPHFHNAALRAADIHAIYVPVPVLPNEQRFCEFMAAVASPGSPTLFDGFSVTLPHKEHALRWLQRQALEGGADRGHTISPRARRVGAVNTLIRSGAEWSGDNSDIEGFLRAMRSATKPWRGGSAHVLGAGGAARAVVAALCDSGCQVMIYNRTPARAVALAREFGCTAAAWEERRQGLRGLVVNCTTVGMAPALESESPVPADAFGTVEVVMDTVYVPRETRLLREARSRGVETVSGIEMFLGQAEAQFESWHGRAVPAGIVIAS